MPAGGISVKGAVMMKKIFSFIIFIFLISVSAYAANEVRTTDICAYINNYPVAAYNLNNQTAVYASSLKNYGFDVEWNAGERRVDITLSDKNISGSGDMIYRFDKDAAGKILSTASDTDIVTYVNGKKAESFNINDYTVIYISALKELATVAWDGEKRVASITIPSKNMKDFEYVPYKYDFEIEVPMLENTVDIKKIGTEKTENGIIYKYDGEKIYLEQVAKYITLMKNCGFICLDDPSVPEDEVAFKKDTHSVVLYLDGNVLCLKLS